MITIFKNIKKYLDKNPKIASIIIVIFFLLIYNVLSIWRNGIIYYVNDDITLKSISEGLYTGGPTLTLVYQVFPFTGLLFILNSITTSIDWYGITLLALTNFFVGYTIYYLIKDSKKLYQKTIITSLLLFIITKIYPHFIISITFTEISTLIALCCLILYMFKNNKLKNVIIAIGLLISFGMRIDSFLIVAPFFLPALFYKNKDNIKGLKNDIILGTVILALIGGCYLIEKKVIMTKEWDNYLEYNSIRSKYNDFYYENMIELPDDEINELFNKAGFDDSERDIVKTNFGKYALKPTIQSKMSNLVNELDKSDVSLHKSIISSTKFLFSTSISKVYLVSLFLLLYFIIIKDIKKKKEGTIITDSLFVLFEFIIIGYAIYKGRLPERVYLPLFNSFIIINMFLVLTKNKIKEFLNNTVNLDKKFFVIFSLLLFLASGFYVRREDIILENIDKENEVINYIANNKDNLYVYDRVEAEYIKLDNNYFPTNYINLSGWEVFSPIYNDKIKKYGVNEMKELLLLDNVYLIEPYNTVDSIYKYYKEYDYDVVVYQIDKINNNYIFKISKK
jgi:hypothetical protein